MFIVERKENVLDVFFLFLHPELFQLYNSWLTILFTNVHMLYLLYSKNRPLL